MSYDWRKPIADIHELDLLNDPELNLQGIISKLLPSGVVLYRSSCRRSTLLRLTFAYASLLLRFRDRSSSFVP